MAVSLAAAAGGAATGSLTTQSEDMYSAGMKKLGEQGFVWNEQNIDKWIANPKAMIPDSPMALAFQGIPDAGERTDIIAYLKTVPAQ